MRSIWPLLAAVLAIATAGCSGPSDGGDGATVSSSSSLEDSHVARSEMSGSFDGTVTILEPTAHHPVQVGEGVTRLRFVLEMVNPLPENGLKLTVTPPGSDLAQDTDTAPYIIWPPNVGVVQFTAPQAGDWDVVIELEGVLASYQVSYCSEPHGWPGCA